ncbi:MAG: Omp28 family outer membrane lipoprotein [Lentimicrobium sp.]|nr:Omp28 family outer membrane lipoprotein [Lentimicrobium sp.]
MKKIKNLLYSAAILSSFTFMVSCDKIEEPFTKKTASIDTAACPVPQFPAVNAVKKRVLLEDYTGHTCVNCPKAAGLAHNLKETHGDQLVLLAIHAGFFANPTGGGDFTYDFRTEAGTAWDQTFGIGMVGNPNGMINRKGFPNNHIVSPTAWGAAVTEALSTQPVIDLQMINEYDADERKLCTHIKTHFISNIDKNLKLVVVLSESGIIKPQKNNDPASGPTPIIYDYEHNHVLRAAITTTWGSNIASVGVTNPGSAVNSFKYILKDEYVPANCSVIAFIYDDETKEILQALETSVL